MFVRLATLVRKLPVIPVIGRAGGALRPLFLRRSRRRHPGRLARPELAANV